ncbi:class I SAM-dependent methyltransferase [Nocardia sp. NPDC004340]
MRAAAAGHEVAHPSDGRNRRLLAAARQRYAEDRLADAVSAGTRQVLVFGTALDTFIAHNPYRDVRVIRVTEHDGGIVPPPGDSESGGRATPKQLAEFVRFAPGFEPGDPVFAIRLDDPGGTATDLGGGPTCPGATRTVLRLLASCQGGAELVLEVPPTGVTSVARAVRDTGWVVQEDLSADTLASRYLDVAAGQDFSVEPRMVRARVAQ